MWGVGGATGTNNNRTGAAQELEGEVQDWAAKPRAWGPPCNLTSPH